jgi:hypothetical protein
MSPARWVHRGLLTIGLLVILAPAASAHPPDPAPPLVPDEVAHRPSPIPDRIILTWNGDTARTQAVTWRTDTSVSRAIAQIARADANPQFVKEAKTVSATTTPLSTDIGSCHCHSVNFTGLEPSTLYAYRVGDGTNWSEWFHFRTASDKPEPFAFIYFGDAQNDLKSLWSRVIRSAYSDATKARFIIHAGDLINRANRDAEWGEWFNAGGWVNGMVPSIPTPGNHEYGREADGPRQLDRHWKPQFTLPDHGPAGLEETVYYIDYQGVRIISLNSNEKLAEQVPWLEKTLSNNPNRWTVITFHHPVFSSARGRDNKEVRELWKPIFDKYRVDLVLQGHDHTYARSNLNIGVSMLNKTSGTVYVVSVSGPKMYNLEREPWMQRAAEDTQLYQILYVNGNTLKYEARTAVGDLYDAFTLQKRNGAPNRLIEQAPRTPERLRAKKAARQ